MPRCLARRGMGREDRTLWVGHHCNPSDGLDIHRTRQHTPAAGLGVLDSLVDVGGGGRDIGQPVGQGALLLGLVEKLHHPADSRLVVHPHSIGAGTAFPHLGAPPDELV